MAIFKHMLHAIHITCFSLHISINKSRQALRLQWWTNFHKSILKVFLGHEIIVPHHSHTSKYILIYRNMVLLHYLLTKVATEKSGLQMSVTFVLSLCYHLPTNKNLINQFGAYTIFTFHFNEEHVLFMKWEIYYYSIL